MAYSTLAASRRRCRGLRRDGTPCRAWALWNDPGQRCRMHSTKRGQNRTYRRLMAATVGHDLADALGRPVRRCLAYRWPHRPGSGLCRWPEEPRAVCATPLGTRGQSMG